MTLVTVITPSFNQAGFLEKTICSVLEQNHPEIEYLVIDGGSTDGSVDIIRKYGPRLAWWTSESDQGQADAIRRGLSRAHGEVIAWLNSDDYYLPGTIADVVDEFAKRPEVAMLYGDVLAVDENGRPIKLHRYRDVKLQDLLLFQIIGQPAVFLRRDAIDATGGPDPAFHLLLDHQLWIRVLLQFRAAHVPRVWAAARYHAAAKNLARAREFGGEAFRILEWARRDPRLGPELARVSSQANSSALRVQARYLLDAGEPAPALRSWFRSLLFWPPTALARLNIAGAAMLELLGLGAVRKAVLRQRQAAITGKLRIT